jgi:hypothetical protein
VIERARLTAESLRGLTAVLAVDLASPTPAERTVLTGFAAAGGLVIAGHGWGGEIPNGQPYAEIPAGKGRVAVYAEDQPDAESVSKDLLDLMDDVGVRVFNMPSVLSYASQSGDGRQLLVQLLNYADFPGQLMTVQAPGGFRTARLYTPEDGIAELPVKQVSGKSEVAIPRLVAAGALLLEK